jgi:hypothetical protein
MGGRVSGQARERAETGRNHKKVKEVIDTAGGFWYRYQQRNDGTTFGIKERRSGSEKNSVW